MILKSDRTETMFGARARRACGGEGEAGEITLIRNKHPAIFVSRIVSLRGRDSRGD